MHPDTDRRKHHDDKPCGHRPKVAPGFDVIAAIIDAQAQPERCAATRAWMPIQSGEVNVRTLT